MKKHFKAGVFCLILLLTLSSGSIYAEEIEKSASASIGFFTHYMWRGFQIHEGAAIQPTMDLTYGNFGVNLWADFNTDDQEHVETDLTLNYHFDVAKVGIDVGYIYYALDAIDDTEEIYLSLAYDTLLSPSITLYQDVDQGNGGYLEATIGHSFALSDDVGVNLGALCSYNMHNDYSFGDYTDFHHAELSASLSFAIRDITIEPMIAYSFSMSKESEDAIEEISEDGEKDYMYAGVSFSLAF